MNIFAQGTQAVMTAIYYDEDDVPFLPDPLTVEVHNANGDLVAAMDVAGLDPIVATWDIPQFQPIGVYTATWITEDDDENVSEDFSIILASTPELDEMRRTTVDLIEDDPTWIAMSRIQWTRSPVGGMVRDDTPSILETVKRYFAGVVTDPRYVTRDEGEMIVAMHVVIGVVGDDIREKDMFEVGNRKFEVVEIHPDTSFQTKGWVVERK